MYLYAQKERARMIRAFSLAVCFLVALGQELFGPANVVSRPHNSNKEVAVRSKYLLAGLLTSTMLCVGASAQQAPRPTAPTQAQTVSAYKHSGEWRASKLIGVNVYNQQNEKIGDINEILLAPDGKIAGVVLGVGGFLGMGEHDVLVKLDQLKFVNEPVRTSAATQPARPAPANTTGTGTAANPNVANANRPTRAANEKWYPDHAVMNTTKDQLKALPQFKYN
jgi:hypothetical protein